MIYDDIVNEVNRGKRLYDLPLRVAYYCRVSTDSDVQLNSLDNQLDYYEKYINNNPNWIFINGYVDEGKSAVTVNKRTSFINMIKDAKDGMFDLIITKEASRFARDLEDSIHYIRKLKEYGVGILFENQNLNTFDTNSELILNIMFNIAQEESKKISSRVKFGHRQAIEKGHVLGSNNITGYKKNKCKLVIIPEEAKFIRTLYELYATGEYGLLKLSKELARQGYFNTKGNLYDKDSLKRMIENPKYKGVYRGHIHETIDYRTKKRKIIPIEKQVIHKVDEEIIPAIVSEELWNRANNILKKRSIDYKKNNSWSGGLKYPLSSKIYCKEHNVCFQRSHGKVRVNRPTWSCSKYLQYGIKECLSPIITEKDLYTILEKTFDDIIPSKEKIINFLVDTYRSTNKDNGEINRINSRIEEIEQKKQMSLDLIFKGLIKEEELRKQFNRFDIELKRLEQEKNYISNRIIDKDYLSREIENELICNSLEKMIRIFVKKIIVSKIDDDRKNIKLDIYLSLGNNDLTRKKNTIIKTKKEKLSNNYDCNIYLYRNGSDI